MTTVGILGGGQLGAMLAEAVYTLGGEAHLYDPDANAPAVRRFAHTTVGPWTDEARLAKFAARCDVLTYEMEHLDTRALRRIAKPIYPSLDVLETTQDRAREKQFLQASGLPHVAFRHAIGEGATLLAAKDLGFPHILKTSRGGYDGKGQWLVRDEAVLASVAEHLARTQGDAFACVLEDIVPLEREVSCIVARAPGGEETVFPVFENAHASHILDWTLVPARIPAEVSAKVSEIARSAARALDVVGLLTTEFFLAKSPAPRSNGAVAAGTHIYVNEFAPRPHNSGHVTRKACTMSQFDALARILLGVPLTEPRLRGAQAYCMGNLLGEVFRGKPDLDLRTLASHPDVLEVMVYGKPEAEPRRKMGHLIVAGDDAEKAIDAVKAFRRSLVP